MKWSIVILGFVLAVIVKIIASSSFFELFGLFIVGVIVGYLVKEGPKEGLINVTVAGGLGGIVSGILVIMLGLAISILGLSIAGLAVGAIGFFAIVAYLIYYAIVMGIGGAIGGIIAKNTG
jgi:hypothetical protein